MDINKFKLFVVVLSITFFSLAGFLYKVSCDNDAQRFYKQGNTFFSQGKYSDAYFNFKQIKPISNLYNLSLLKQYSCANKLSDKKTSYLTLKEIIKTTKSEHIKAWALYNEVILSSELKLNSNATLAKKFTLVEEKFSNSDFAPASSYKIAQLYKEKNPTLAKEKYIKYLNYAPIGKYSKNSLDELTKLEDSLTLDDIATIANSHFENRQFSLALEYYQKLPFSKYWDKIAKCYKETKNSQEEKKVISKAFKLKISEVDEKEYAFFLDRYIILSKNDKLSTLQYLFSNLENSIILPTVTYKLAQISPEVRAIKLYEKVAQDYPNSIWASNSLWEVFWYNYLQARYKTCEKLAKKHLALYSKQQDGPRVAYWYGRVLLKIHQNMRAREMFYDVINDYPLNYYSFLSARQLKMSKATKMIVKKAIKEYDIDNLNNTIFNDETLIKLANDNEWELIEDFKINDPFVKSWISNKKGDYLTSINLAKDELLKIQNDNSLNKDNKITFSNKMLKLVYPVIYEDLINENAKKYKLSPYLFLSLIREESHFNKNAKSSVGAIGLSQLMPATANFIQNTKVTNKELLDPSKNIALGLKYFNYLVNKFNGNEYLAILAYNAGPGNINKWLSDKQIKSNEIDVFVENIPYLETKNYIKKILCSYWVYLNIYSTKNR